MHGVYPLQIKHKETALLLPRSDGVVVAACWNLEYVGFS